MWSRGFERDLYARIWRSGDRSPVQRYPHAEVSIEISHWCFHKLVARGSTAMKSKTTRRGYPCGFLKLQLYRFRSCGEYEFVFWTGLISHKMACDSLWVEHESGTGTHSSAWMIINVLISYLLRMLAD